MDPLTLAMCALAARYGPKAIHQATQSIEDWNNERLAKKIKHENEVRAAQRREAEETRTAAMARHRDRKAGFDDIATL